MLTKKLLCNFYQVLQAYLTDPDMDGEIFKTQFSSKLHVYEVMEGFDMLFTSPGEYNKFMNEVRLLGEDKLTSFQATLLLITIIENSKSKQLQAWASQKLPLIKEHVKEAVLEKPELLEELVGVLSLKLQKVLEELEVQLPKPPYEA